MKIPKAIVIVMFVQVMVVITASAQVTFISSTNKPTGAFLTVGSDMWRGQGFFTGPNSLGYRLDSIELLMANASGAPSGFSVSLYSYTDAYFPGELLWTLAGSADPLIAEVYSYVGADITLFPRLLL